MKKQNNKRMHQLLLSLLLVCVLLVACASCRTTVLVRFMDQDGNILGSSDLNGGADAEPASAEAANTPSTEAATAAPATAAPATAAPTTQSSKKEYTAEEIDAMIQGTWVLPGKVNSYFTFDNGKLSIVSGSATMNGTYTVDTSNSKIMGTLQATDGTSNMQLHYGFSTDGKFCVFNNNYIGLNKQ